MFLDNIEKLTPTFRDAMEKFIPGWLETLLPYYQEAKQNGDDILELANYKPMGAVCNLYTKNGISYYHFTTGNGLKILAFNSDDGYRRVNWRECLIEQYPDFDIDPDAKMGKFCELTKNALYFDSYAWRVFNRKPPYDDLNNKIDAYFKQLTGDDKVGFSLSSTSMLYFNPRAKMYINNNCSFW